MPLCTTLHTLAPRIPVRIGAWSLCAFVIDVFARRIVGWKASPSMQTDLVLDALEQALHARKPVGPDRLIHHSNRDVQYVSIRYTERLAEAGLEPSVGSVGDSYDNPLTETINGLYKAEVIHRKSSWRTHDEVEWATRTWIDWFNNRRLLEPIGSIPPAEAEANYYSKHKQPNESAMSERVSGKSGAVHPAIPASLGGKRITSRWLSGLSAPAANWS